MRRHSTTATDGTTVVVVLRRAFVIAAAATAITAAAFGTVAILADQATLDMSSGASSVSTFTVEPEPATERAPRAARALVARHGCWTSAAGMPADMTGRVPGHVVVTTPGESRPMWSADLVGPALDVVFGDRTRPDLVIHAFCR